MIRPRLFAHAESLSTAKARIGRHSQRVSNWRTTAVYPFRRKLAGSNDCLIRFTYRDAEDLERFHTEVLMRLPGVMRSNSMLVLRTVKKTTALAL